MTLPPPSAVKITKPAKGEVTITLPYDEAEILARAVGEINAGSLLALAPELSKVMDRLIGEFGRSNMQDARRYLLSQRVDKQFYIIDHEGED